MPKNRYLHPFILKDLAKKMVFVGGPRQVGKTTLAKTIAETFQGYQYLNWDNTTHHQQILKEQFQSNAKLLIFDELHKYPRWKRYLKGLYDVKKDIYRILVTGSAHLDLYRKGGDAMTGRYYHYRLHPFSVAELLHLSSMVSAPGALVIHQKTTAKKIAQQLFQYSGFPEPFFEKDKQALARWQNQRMDTLIKQDIRDVELVRDISALQILSSLLPEKVGSRLSLNSLREDLEVAHRSITLWIDIFERFYYLFRIYPYSKNIARSLRKEAKMYLWDWTQVTDQAARLENMVASHLLKFVDYLYDVQGVKAALHYLRDLPGHEVDFLVTIDQKPWFAVEVKWSDQTPSKHLLYFSKRSHIPQLYQVVWEPEDIDVLWQGVRVVSVGKFLTGLV